MNNFVSRDARHSTKIYLILKVFPMIDVSVESMLAINYLGCHQSLISPLPVHATAGPVFIKQNKYQILINCKCCIKGTNIYKVYQVYTLSIDNFSFNGFNFQILKSIHEVRELEAFTSADIAMDMVCIARWKRVQHRVYLRLIYGPIVEVIFEAQMNLMHLSDKSLLPSL